MKVGSLFSGIGGLDLGLERAGMEIRWQVENDPWCNLILEKHWFGIPRYGDIHDIEDGQLEPVDLICGGFPCQPVSVAGARKAQEDDRWLWPQFARIVRMVRPRYVLVENVPGLASRGMGDILGDLAALGYDAEWESLPAAAFGAPHLRYRIFIVAYPVSSRVTTNQRVHRRNDRAGSTDRRAVVSTGPEMALTENPIQSGSYLADPEVFAERPGLRACQSSRQWGRRSGDFCCPFHFWQSEPDVGRVANGIPRRVDRLRGLGNAVVPQVAEWVGRQILRTEPRA
jgi:DNA (cytosine-5)-methyltransferase 1